jgi:hypothetical protein
LKVPRILPYLIGLIVLAFALGSLPRGTPGGSLLFRAYWLLYLVYLGPVLILGAMAAAIIIIALNYRDIAGAIGFQMARQRKMRKRRSRKILAFQILIWVLAIGVLVETKSGIFRTTHLSNSTFVTNIVGGNAPPPSLLQIGGFLPALSNLVQNSWFIFALFGMIVVGGVLVVESIKVALKETADASVQDLKGGQVQGLQAVHEAIELVEDQALDPRSRIIACYQHLIATVSRLGADVSSDLTARELDRAVRSTLALRGPASTELTQLFEEARYSLHQIADGDVDKAHECLEAVAEELKIQLHTET